MIKKCVLITGASGFLGRHLVKLCLIQGFTVVGIDRNPQPVGLKFIKYINSPINEVDWNQLLTEYKPYCCFHLAASASVSASIADPFGDFSRVLPSTARLLHSIANCSPQSKFIFFSSAALYGNPTHLPIAEDALVQPISPYGVHKHVAEQLIYSIGGCYGINTVCLRIFSAYGEGLRRQIFFDLYKKLKLAEDSGEKTVSLFGTGFESRDFIHGQDVARAALAIALNLDLNGHTVFNVGSGVETIISDAVNEFIDILGLKVTILFDGQVRPGDPRNWKADVSKLESIGFKSEITLRNGLIRYKDWLRLNIDLFK